MMTRRRRPIQLRRERTRGSIEPGKLADFVVLDDDLLTCSEERLRRLRPQMTVIAGRIAFEQAGDTHR